MANIEQAFYNLKIWCDRISSVAGLKKQEVIKNFYNFTKEKEDISWRLFVIYMNPLITFNIGKKSLDLDLKESNKSFADALDLINFLSSANSLSNNDISIVKSSLNNIKNEDVKAFAIEYITRQLKVGITAKTLNKSIGKEAIPIFSCMLANKFFEHPKSILNKEICITEKLDGIRAVTIIRLDKKTSNMNVSIISRQGQIIAGLKDIEAEIVKSIKSFIKEKPSYLNRNWMPLVLDGELLITDRKDIPSKEQYKQTIKIVRSDLNEDKKGVTYNIFDMLPFNEFNSDNSLMTYSERRYALNHLNKHIKTDVLKIVPVEQVVTFSNIESAMNTITRLVNQARRDNKEGIMINVSGAAYQRKRTNDLLKVKVFQDCDLSIIGFEEGNGKYSGTLGAIIADYKGNPVKVGTGITDDQRIYMWDHKEEFLGRVITVQYFEETCNADGVKSIRFPVFKELRELGKEVSYN